MQVLAVRKYGVALGTEEVDVPDVEQAHQRDGVVLERGVAEVLVDGVEASRNCWKRSGPSTTISDRPTAESTE